MSTSTTNQFTSYILSSREELEGSIFSLLQKQVIQNELSLIAAQKMALDYDPSNPVAFAQSEALLKGQLQVYNLLLDKSAVAESEMLRAAQQESNS